MKVQLINKKDKAQIDAYLKLMNEYRMDPMGGIDYIAKDEEKLFLNDVLNHCSMLIFLLKDEQAYVGMANCFVNYSTFMLKKFINIHDIVVTKKARGNGLGSFLLEEICRYAKERNFGKVTLEVREDNRRAMKVYQNMGFNDCDPKMFYWEKKTFN